MTKISGQGTMIPLNYFLLKPNGCNIRHPYDSVTLEYTNDTSLKSTLPSVRYILSIIIINIISDIFNHYVYPV